MKKKYYLRITTFAVCMGLVLGSCELADPSLMDQEQNKEEGEQEEEQETEEETGTGSVSGTLSIAAPSDLVEGSDFSDRDAWLFGGSISGVTVKLSKLEGEEGACTLGTVSTVTTDGASYAFTSLPAGTYRLEAEKGPYDFIKEETITVETDAVTEDIELAVFPGLKLTVKVDETPMAFTLPVIYQTSGTSNIDLNIDWGDGTPVVENLTDRPESTEDDNYTHNYSGSLGSSAAEFTIRITGTCTTTSNFSFMGINFGLDNAAAPKDGDDPAATGYLSRKNRDMIIKAAGNVTALGGERTDHTYGFLFYDCRKLADISGLVFTDDYYGNVSNEFLSYAFSQSGITTVPASLLPAFNECGQSFLNHTFGNCPNLTTIEDGFLKNMTGEKSYLMKYSFENCAKLTHINLFSEGTAAPTMDILTSMLLSMIPINAFLGVGTEVSESVTLRIYSSTLFDPGEIAGGLLDENVKEIFVSADLVSAYQEHTKWGGGGITTTKFKALP
jgi:hypothetical protein